ncbi:MAG: ribonuclease HII, partial [Elusimicrobiota bacterium]|nr:ribonuclease HII [Elusimicrobiota bacterium]
MSYYKFDRKIQKRVSEKQGETISRIRIAGVDEAGRGALAGPVVAGAVILPQDKQLRGIKDSKLLSPEIREKKYEEILKEAVSAGIGIVSHSTIDSINIHQATYKAMKLAIKRLSVQPDLILVDGPYRIPEIRIPQIPVIGGDRKSAAIAAASIIAKVTRDRIMVNYSKKFPKYQLHKNKGYATKEHKVALTQYGNTKIHRVTFFLDG